MSVRPTLAIMAYGGIKEPTLQAVVAELTASALPWTLKLAASDAAVDRARSTVASSFLASSSGSDVLVMIDHDLSWSPGHLSYLAQVCADRRAVVGGMVSKRLLERGFGGRFADGVRHEYGSYEIVKLGINGYIGGAFMAIHREVLETLCATVPNVRSGFRPFFLPMVRRNDSLEVDEYLSEDWAFCQRCHDAGIPVYAAMHPFVTHWGDFGYTVLSGVQR